MKNSSVTERRESVSRGVAEKEKKREFKILSRLLPSNNFFRHPFLSHKFPPTLLIAYVQGTELREQLRAYTLRESVREKEGRERERESSIPNGNEFHRRGKSRGTRAPRKKNEFGWLLWLYLWLANAEQLLPRFPMNRQTIY